MIDPEGDAVRPTVGTDTLPRVESAEHASDGMDVGEGILHRVRSSPRLAIAAAVGALLVVAWIAWAVYVTSDQGARAGLGVVIVWPAMLAALALISLPFIGGYLLIRRLSTAAGDESGGTGEAEAGQNEDGSQDEPDESSEDNSSDEGEEDDEESTGEADDDSEDEPESNSEAEASAAS